MEAVPCLLGAPQPIDRLGADQRGPAGFRARRGERRGDGLAVLAIDVRQHVPAIGLEALGRVVGEPAHHLAVDGDPVVVVDHDELAELLRAGERSRLVRDPLHHAAVAEEDVGVMIDDACGRGD